MVAPKTKFLASAAIRLAVALCFFFAATALAEYNWTWTVGCPEDGTSSATSTFTATNDHGFSGSGTCQRVPAGFTEFTFTTYNSPPQQTTFYGAHTGDLLLIPPTWDWDRRPIVTSASECPALNKNLNWVISHWDQSFASALNGIPMTGTATYSTSTGLQIDFGYDVTGGTILTGPLALGGTCSSGSMALTGAGDRGGTVYFTRAGTGHYLTQTNKRFFFVPQYTVTAATDLGSRTMKGYSFNSQTAASTKYIQVTTNAAGTSWTVNAYSDVAAETLDGTFTDTISISAVNSPANGILSGTLTRTGAGAGTGDISCIVGKGLFTRVLCSAETPNDNTVPMAFVFSIEGPHLVGKASGTSTANEVSFNAAEGVASDGTRLIVADTTNNRVLIWNSIPTTTATTPDLVLGQPDLQSNTSNNGGRTATSMASPRGVWTNGTKLVVADTSNHRVLIWNTFPTTDRQAADVVLGQPGFTTATSGISSQRYNAPYNVASDGTKLFVADYSNNRVVVYNSIPTVTNTAADFVLGQPSLTVNTANNGGISASTLNGAIGVATAGTKLFVSDYSNNRVLIWNSIPSAMQTAADVVLGQPDMVSNTANNGGVGSGTLRQPRGLASDGTKLVVADRTNNRVLVWNTIPTANQTTADVVLGQTTFTATTANNGGRTGARVSTPRGIACDGTKLYVADSGNHRVLVYNSIPVASGAAADTAQGQPNMTTGTANIGGLSEYTVNGPQRGFSDGTHYIAVDSANNRVLIWNSVPTSNYQPADIVLGQPDFYSNTANNGGVSAQTLNAPNGAYSDGTKLFVADSTNNRILIWNTFPTTVQQAADIVLGQPNLTSNTSNNGGRNAQSLSSPVAVTSSGGKLFVADRANNRVLVWNTIPTVTQTAADVVLGQSSMAGGTANSGGLSAQTLSSPRDVMANGSYLFVADSSNNRVLIWNAVPTVNQTAADVVLGQPDMASNTADNGGLAATALEGPYGVYSQGTQVYVSDTANNRVLIWTTIPTSNQTAATQVFGQPNLTSATANNGGLTSQRVSSPRQLYSDGKIVFVSDFTNNRIVAFEPP